MNDATETPAPAEAASMEPPEPVLEAFALERAPIERLPSGLINLSFGVRLGDGRAAVLQRVNRIFPPAIHTDIEAVTRHVAAKGLTTPRLLPTRAGSLWLEHEDEIWRLMTRIAGRTFDIVTSDAQAREAGRALGSFHAALADFDRPLQRARPDVHDTARHLAALERVLDRAQAHPLHGEAAALGRRLFAQAAVLGDEGPPRERIVHGDPKISNILFDAGRAVCMIDLDTLGHMPVVAELGDALRSWCSPTTEDSDRARLLPSRFEAAVAGYADSAGPLLSAAEWRALPHATHRIAVELAARFLADALEERYFGWDPARYPSAGAHNLARARSQLGLAESIAGLRGRLAAIVAGYVRPAPPP